MRNSVPDPENGAPQRDWVPRPDPTLLTTEQSNRLRAEMQREVQALREIFETRLDAMDVASELLRTSQTKTVTLEELLSKLKDLKELISEKLEGTRNEFLEKFVSIKTQFEERDVRTKASDDTGKLAIKDALQAQKESAAQTQQSNAEAITKSENNTTKQLDSIQRDVKSIESNLNDKISELRRALDRGEGTIMGKSENRTDTRQNVGMIVGMVGGGLGFIMTIVGVITLVFALAHSSPPIPATQGAPLTVTVPSQK